MKVIRKFENFEQFENFGSLDVRIEFRTKAVTHANTSAYGFILSETNVQYTPLTDIVKRLFKYG